MKSKFSYLFLLLAAPLLHGQATPSLMSYQGRVTDATGTLIGNTNAVNRNVIFRLYNTSSGGTALWAESQSVTISGGEFGVLIGNGTGIANSPGPASPANTPYKTLSDIINSGTYSSLYLGVTVDDGTNAADPEISPRQQMVSGAFAQRAKVAETVAGGAVTTAMMGDGVVSTVKIASGAVDSSRIADSTIVSTDIANSTITAGKLDTTTIGLWSPSGTSVYRSSGNVGIGEASPGFPLNFGSSTGDKISLYGNSGSHSGFGIQNSLLQIHSDVAATDIAFGYGSSSSFTERMRIRGNGNVGIGTISPTEKLMVSGGSVRVASISNPYVAIANVNGAGETINQATLGVATSAGSGSSSAAANDAILKSDSSKLILQSGTGAAAIVIDTSNNVTTGNIYAKVLMARDFTSSHSQGAHLEWNKDGGSGATYLLNQKGLGGGGMIFGEVSASNDVSERMRIASSGNVGIGTGSPRAKLEVSGSNEYSYDRKAYLDDNGAAGTDGSATWSVSILASNVVVADEFGNSSDVRIKKDLKVTNSALDLDTLLGLEVTNYHLKDAISKGTQLQKKLIAQQVESVYPQAVNQTVGVVPDIYKKATVKDGWIELATDLKVGDRVKLISQKEEAVHEVLEVSEGAFRPDGNVDADSLFVYGREVDDFRIVDYDAISMLNVSATQELSKKLEEKDAVIAALEARLSALEKRASAAK